MCGTYVCMCLCMCVRSAGRGGGGREGRLRTCVCTCVTGLVGVFIYREQPMGMIWCDFYLALSDCIQRQWLDFHYILMAPSQIAHARTPTRTNTNSVQSHKKFKEKAMLPFTLLSDSKKEVARAFLNLRVRFRKLRGGGTNQLACVCDFVHHTYRET